jgi:DNA-binding MarR family transcriptional regulator|tara:strand:- start:2014 stop:2475 length:462 start_codon:yes stop_codon:yes gene_type:complete
MQPSPISTPEPRSGATDPVVLDEQVAHLLRRAHQRASSVFLHILSERKLTPTQFFAMARLYEMGQLSQNHLGRLSAMDPATIQGVIQRLTERGFVHRMPDPTDRRRMVLKLSSEGEQLVIRLLEGARQVNDALLDPLSGEERETFIRLLGKMT